MVVWSVSDDAHNRLNGGELFFGHRRHRLVGENARQDAETIVVTISVVKYHLGRGRWRRWRHRCRRRTMLMVRVIVVRVHIGQVIILKKYLVRLVFGLCSQSQTRFTFS